MFFNITNGLVIFQTIINNIFHNLIVESIMIVYLNNILIFTWTLEKYYKVVCRVLEVLAKYKLFLFFKKYEFDKLYIEYLGLIRTTGSLWCFSRVCNFREILSDIVYNTTCITHLQRNSERKKQSFPEITATLSTQRSILIKQNISQNIW